MLARGSVRLISGILCCDVFCKGASCVLLACSLITEHTGPPCNHPERPGHTGPVLYAHTQANTSPRESEGVGLYFPEWVITPSLSASAQFVCVTVCMCVRLSGIITPLLSGTVPPRH